MNGLRLIAGGVVVLRIQMVILNPKRGDNTAGL